ncbi:MAG: putative Ig domain-containing protein, partial [Pseudomonadota bacterium]
MPNGRYLRISVLFRRATTGESPILYDLSVGTEGYALPAQTNTPPVVDAGADQLNAIPIPAKLKGSVCDDSLPNGALAFTWSKVSGPGTVTFANANAIETTATFSAAGTYALRLTASDSQLSASHDLTVTVEGTNRPPVITSTPPASTCSNRPYSYQVIATDPNAGDVLTYSLPTAPTGMTINTSTGLIQWTPTQAQGGSHNVKVRVTDLGNNQVEQTWTINVTAAPPNSPPAITSTAPTGAAVDVPYVYQVTANDPDPCEVLAYSLDAAPAGMTINPTTGLIQWAPAASQTGNHNVTVRVRDFSGAPATQSFTINVGPRDNTPPVVSLTSPAIGATLNSDVPVIGSVSDANLQSWVLEYKVFGGNT